MTKQAGRPQGGPLDPIRPIYLLHGEDDLAVQQFVDELRRRTVDESFAEFDFQEVDAAALTVPAILAEVAQLPFGSPHRTTVVRGIELFRKKDRSAEADALADGLARLSPAACVVLVARGSAEKVRGKAGQVNIAGPRLDALVQERGKAVAFAVPAAERLAEQAVEMANALGVRLAGDAAGRLVQAARGEPRALRNELAKVVAYVGDAGVVTLRDVDAVCSVDAEDVMFRLVDAIGHRTTHRALALLREVCRYENKPHAVAGRLLALLGRQLKLIWQCRHLIDRNIGSRELQNLPAEVAAELPTEASVLSVVFRVRDYYTMATRWNATSLARAYDALAACDVANKGGDEGSQDVLMNLEVLIIRLCAAP